MRRKRRRIPRYRKPPLTVARILAWADDYKRRIGRWPNQESGRIRPHDESWLAINVALGRGNRGLPGGSSLANLLYEHRGVRNLKNLPRLNEPQIIRWARASFKRTGKWPMLHAGAVADAPGETWFAIDWALRRGQRGLPGGSSLADVLAVHGIKRNPKRLPPLTADQILIWADAYFRGKGGWPLGRSGPIAESPTESWSGIDTALRHGLRGLRGESSLPAFLNKHRNLYRGKSRRPKSIQRSKRLTEDKIMTCAQAWRRKTGGWPRRDSGPISGTSGERWSAVDAALKRGYRGLPGGSSLSRLLAGRR
jgi:hypothetical protein